MSIKAFSLRFTLLFVVPLVAIVVALNWYAGSLRYVSTDNAYVKANIITITPSIDGRVISLAVRDNQHVAAGDELLRLDDRSHQIGLQQATARLDAVVHEI
ncbi:MAG: biotin/lipoyl-binding protein, partial [Pseudomonadota bacterium]